MCIESQIKDQILSQEESPVSQLWKRKKKLQKLYQLVIHKKKA